MQDLSIRRRTPMKKIEILGTGCQNCVKLAKNAEEAVKENRADYEIEKVTDIKKIMQYGVMMTPGLVVDGKVVSVGKVLSADQIKKLLE
jgi:small redox-active disulfide protein 2